jgi:hypothetical protein
LREEYRHKERSVSIEGNKDIDTGRQEYRPMKENAPFGGISVMLQRGLPDEIKRVV